MEIQRFINAIHMRRFALFLALATLPLAAHAEDSAAPRAFIDGSGPGWRALGEADFVNVNCDPDTWTWREDGVDCTGQPIGILRSTRAYTNFEMVLEWRHLRRSGNSGIFVWIPEESWRGLTRGQLPQGIEFQILDHGYAEDYAKEHGRQSEWFTTHGDVFPTGASKMTPFPPAAPRGERSFPSKNLSRGYGEWNHYYIRCINGEVRLWVNGEEVSGGTHCSPATGYLALESEGSPIEFRRLRIREVP
jgi:hypothetical protein